LRISRCSTAPLRNDLIARFEARSHIDHTRGFRGGHWAEKTDPHPPGISYLRLDRAGPDGSKRFRFPFAIPILVRDTFGNEHRAEPVLIAWVSTRRSSLGTLMSMPASSSSEASDESINHPRAHPVALFHSFRRPESSEGSAHSGPASLISANRDAQRVTIHVNPSSRFFSMGSARPSTPLPRKVGFCKRPISCKLLKGWSGRRDSNPRVQLGNMSVDCK
jgi:hypothetical protein